jgi:hypothetical protein
MDEHRYRDHRVADGKHRMEAPYQITLASFLFYFVKDISFVSACNAEFYNNLKVVYFYRGQNFIPFSKRK